MQIESANINLSQSYCVFSNKTVIFSAGFQAIYLKRRYFSFVTLCFSITFAVPNFIRLSKPSGLDIQKLFAG